MERFHHMITIPYTRNKPPSWCTTCYSMLLAVYAISIKNPQVNVYIVVLAYIAMVFCPIQHILEALYVYHSFHEDHHRSSYLVVHQHGGCFLFSFIISKMMMSHENALLNVGLGKGEVEKTTIWKYGNE